MNYTINTNILANGNIEQILLFNSDIENTKQEIMREIFKAKEDGIRNALIKLGWTPPPN